MYYFPKIKICINGRKPSLVSGNASTRWNMERVYVWKPSLIPGNASTTRNMEKGMVGNLITLVSGNAST